MCHSVCEHKHAGSALLSQRQGESICWAVERVGTNWEGIPQQATKTLFYSFAQNRIERDMMRTQTNSEGTNHNTVSLLNSNKHHNSTNQHLTPCCSLLYQTDHHTSCTPMQHFPPHPRRDLGGLGHVSQFTMSTHRNKSDLLLSGLL